FPELLNYEFLKTEFEGDYESFMTQYMNDSWGGQEIVFTPEIINAATMDNDQMPFIGERAFHFRFPCPARGMRKGGGVVTIQNRGRLFVLDAVTVFGSPTIIVKRMFELLKRYGIHRVTIEQTPGAESFGPVVENYSLTEDWPVTINWLDFEPEQAARDLRIRALEPNITAKRVIINESIRILGQLRH